MTKSCAICGGTEEEGEVLVTNPCRRHDACVDCVKSYFESAIRDESLYPPQCCHASFEVTEYEEYIPFEVQWQFQVKEQEYSVLRKFRVYCGACGTFLHPRVHTTDPESGKGYAPCQADGCSTLTCVSCKCAIKKDPADHICEESEEDKEFRKAAEEKGYKECFSCGSTIELAEACNHITCSCGHSFCYICGEDWFGVHGCPQYGPARYDEDGYNQDGFHRDTGLDRDGLTRQEREERNDEHDQEDQDEQDEQDDDDGQPGHAIWGQNWDVVQHLDEEAVATLLVLPFEEREDELVRLRIHLFETQGFLFNQNFDQDDEDQDDEDQEDEDQEDEEQDPEENVLD